MVYQIRVAPSALRSIKKLNPTVKKKLQIAITSLAKNPESGEKLRKEFKGLVSLHLKITNTEYRVVYTVDYKNQTIVILYAATRENFYKELKRLV